MILIFCPLTFAAPSRRYACIVMAALSSANGNAAPFRLVQFAPPLAAPVPVPMCTIAKVPSFNAIGAALCDHVLIATSLKA